MGRILWTRQINVQEIKWSDSWTDVKETYGQILFYFSGPKSPETDGYVPSYFSLKLGCLCLKIKTWPQVLQQSFPEMCVQLPAQPSYHWALELFSQHCNSLWIKMSKLEQNGFLHHMSSDMGYFIQPDTDLLVMEVNHFDITILHHIIHNHFRLDCVLNMSRSQTAWRSYLVLPDSCFPGSKSDQSTYATTVFLSLG